MLRAFSASVPAAYSSSVHTVAQIRGAAGIRQPLAHLRGLHSDYAVPPRPCFREKKKTRARARGGGGGGGGGRTFFF